MWFRKPNRMYLVFLLLTALITYTTNACGNKQDPEVLTNTLGMKFVLIPTGSFMMGSSEVYKTFGKAEFPQHSVKISNSFFLQTREITQSQWKSVMGTEPWKGKKQIKTDCPNCPAVYLSYPEVQEFIKRLNQKEKTDRYRLPTEAEWEYACRAGTDTFYSFGDDLKKLDTYAWHAGNTNEKGETYAHEVGNKKPNSWGLYDMHGNVWELCSDWFDPEYYKDSPSRDPKGPQASKFGRTKRGGSYYFMPMALGSAIRFPAGDIKRSSDIGFRLVAEQKNKNASLQVAGFGLRASFSHLGLNLIFQIHKFLFSGQGFDGGQTIEQGV